MFISCLSLSVTVLTCSRSLLQREMDFPYIHECISSDIDFSVLRSFLRNMFKFFIFLLSLGQFYDGGGLVMFREEVKASGCLKLFTLSLLSLIVCFPFLDA